MKMNEFYTQIKSLLNEQGVTQFELYYKRDASADVAAYQGEIDQFSQSDCGGVSLRVITQNKMGYASTQSICQASAHWLAKAAVDCAMATENTEIDPIYTPETPTDSGRPQQAINFDTQTLKHKLLKGEETCANADPRVSAISDAVAAVSSTTRYILSEGKNLSDSQTNTVVYYSPICRENDQVYNEYHMEFAPDIASLDCDACAKKAVQTTLSFVGSAPVKSGSYPVALSPKVSSDLLSCFCGIFSALNASKGLSLLKDKVGQQIACGLVTLTDAPQNAHSLLVRQFDDQGVPTYEKNIIENGVLQTLLHNMKTASEFGVQTTANAYRSSYTSPILIAAQNLYFAPTDMDQDTLLSQEQQLLYITDTKGLHAGANPTTGDFSLECKGYLYQDGKRIKPVSGITVAGNYYQLLKDVCAVANDLEFGGPSGSCVGSPTVLIKSLSVAGE